MRLSKEVLTIKSNTSKILKQKCNFLKKVNSDDKDIWAKGYFVTIFDIPEKIIQASLLILEKGIQKRQNMSSKSTTLVKALVSIKDC